MRGLALFGVGAVAAVAALGVPPPAGAHEFWLAPSRYSALKGVSVEVRAHVGDGFTGPAQGFAAERVVRFEARMARTFELAPNVRSGSLVWARVVPSDTEGILFIWESGFVRTELPGERFEAYLAEDGLDAALEARRKSGASGPGIERYRRCAKMWIDGTSAARATKPAGLPLEILPASRPGRDSTLSVQVVFEGKPLSGVLVRAWRAPLGNRGTPVDAEGRPGVEEVWRSRTDAQGRALVSCAEPGEWLIGAVHMVPSRDRSVADWESTWASLTFSRGTQARGESR